MKYYIINMKWIINSDIKNSAVYELLVIFINMIDCIIRKKDEFL